jgi:GH24 family phage-related lysozyme (muramidase)
MKWYIWLIISIVLIALLMAVNYRNVLSSFLPSVEGFSSKPYWDVSRWSWGYGTLVPGSTDNKNIKPSGTITRQTAFDEMMKHINTDYAYLAPLIKVTLKPQQLAALLSFSYNLGSGNAKKLVPYINTSNTVALGEKWKMYIYAGGLPNQNLIDRRAKEWKLYNS